MVTENMVTVFALPLALLVMNVSGYLRGAAAQARHPDAPFSPPRAVRLALMAVEAAVMLAAGIWAGSQ